MSEKPTYDELRKRSQALEAAIDKLARDKAKLEEVVAQWRLFAENLHEVLYIVDFNGVAAYISPKMPIGSPNWGYGNSKCNCRVPRTHYSGLVVFRLVQGGMIFGLLWHAAVRTGFGFIAMLFCMVA